jgi:WD40 repeat protein
MDVLKNENLLRLVFETFISTKVIKFFIQMKNSTINQILLKILNMQKSFNSIAEPKRVFKYSKSINTLTSYINNTIITTSEDSRLKILNMNEYKYYITLPEHINFAHIASLISLPNGNIAFSTWFNNFKILDSNMGFCCISSLEIYEYDALRHLLMLPNGHIAIAAVLNDDSYVLVLNYNNEFISHNLFNAQGNEINSFVNLNNNRFACGMMNSDIRIWVIEGDSYTCVKILNGNSESIDYLLYIDDCELLLAGADDKTNVWDLNNYECIRTIEGMSCLLYLRDGYFASSSWDNKIKIWSLLGFRCVSILEGHHAVIQFMLLLEGKRIVSADDKEILVWC